MAAAFCPGVRGPDQAYNGISVTRFALHDITSGVLFKTGKYRLRLGVVLLVQSVKPLVQGLMVGFKPDGVAQVINNPVGGCAPPCHQRAAPHHDEQH
jgi:hypothetical protein